MRVQLQQGTQETDSVVKMGIPLIGVTVGQMGSALRELYYKRFDLGWWPSQLDTWLYASIVQLSQTMANLPPNGVFTVGQILTRQTVFQNRNYRVDVDNLSGHNLRR